MLGRVLLVQLPIPPLGPEPIRGNVPLAGAYLKMFAEGVGLGRRFAIELFPSALANTLADQDLVHAILHDEPWLVGFSCCLWNIDRTLWLCGRLKAARPDLKIVLGGPEITLDNEWVLAAPAVDYAVVGEGEQTFAELLSAFKSGASPDAVPGLLALGAGRTDCGERKTHGAAARLTLPLADAAHSPSLPPPSVTRPFLPRSPLPTLEPISSPYLAGILDAADENMLLLETLRGCVFKCKFCYYPKSYDDLHYLSEEKILANLRHAQERGAREVVLLDPTLNQGRNFDDFVRLLIRGNPDRAFTYFGELRAEGIGPATAKLLRQANFTEVEIGLQSIDPLAMKLMDRNNNLKAVERGIKALRDEGIRVKVDLILGLPGDTVDSVRRGMDYLADKAIYDDLQVFNLAILPGTAFRQEAKELGLIFQPRPPYYVTRTPTLRTEDLHQLMAEAAEIFGIDWDPLPPPRLTAREDLPAGVAGQWKVDLGEDLGPPPGRRAQAFTLWMRSADFGKHAAKASELTRRLLAENPFTTLQIVLEPTARLEAVTPRPLERLWATALEQPTYLDRSYALQPGRPIGAKRLIVLLPAARRETLDPEWLEALSGLASLAWKLEDAEAALCDAAAALMSSA